MSGGSGVRSLLALALAIAGLAFAGPASAGQIIYTHGGGLWAVNDNGSGAPHELLSAAQVGGTIGLSGGGNDGVSVQPNGTGVAFDAAVPAPGTPSCDGETHCDGLYSLVNGKLTRLTAAAGNCETAINECGGEDEDPAVTGTGQVVYYSFFVDTTFSGCGFYYCGYTGGLVEQYYSVPLAGDQTPTAWPTPPKQNGEYPNGAEPQFEGPIASDPADPTKIAYGGTYLTGLNVGLECGPDGDSDCYPLDVESSSGAYTQTSLDDSFYYGFAFSPDGSHIADIETGDHKGVWIYPSSQSITSPAASQVDIWAVEDPDDVSGAGQFDQVINGLTWAGSGLVVSADSNLWLIPDRCLTTPTTGSDPTPNCHFPQDATQLTHDGTSSAPDGDPAWTSSTATIEPYGASSNNGGHGGSKFTVTVKLSANQKVVKQKGLDGTIECNQACGVAIAGGVKVKGSSKLLQTKTVAKVLSSSRTVKFSLSFSSANLSKLKKALKKHKHVSAEVVAVAKNGGGTKAQAAKGFTVTR
jgi:hypothetical protein